MNTWGIRGTLAAAGVAAVIAGVGGAAIYAATDANTHLMGAGRSAPGPPPAGNPVHDGPGSGTRDEPVVHSETVLPDGHGGYRTELSQTGTITAMDAGSVTARSADGFTQNYVFPAIATVPPFSIGDQVLIRATRVGAQATVMTIRPPMTH